MGLFGTVKEAVKQKAAEMNPATRIERRIQEHTLREEALKKRMAEKEDAYANKSLNKEVNTRLKEKYEGRRAERREGSFADRLKAGFEGAGGGMFGGGSSGGFSNPFDKMGFGGSSSGRRGSRRDSGALGGDALSVLGVGSGGSSRSGHSRGTTIHVHVGGSGGKRRRRNSPGGGGRGYSNPMSGLGF